MDESVKTINNYYTNLKYNINKKDALKKISDLTSKLILQDDNNVANRLGEIASIIQNNFLLFTSVCEHEDVVANIIDYLKHFSVQIMYDMKGECEDMYEIVTSILLTIYNMHLESEVQLFLEIAITKYSGVHDIIIDSYKNLISNNRNIEMILLEEADLYAFINCLKIESVVSFVNKIWIQISIKQNFQWLIKKYFRNLKVPVHIFQSKQELLKSEVIDSKIKILSIWSEDIVGARNLAMSLKKHIIFINTHMNFSPGILLPYTKLFQNTLILLSCQCIYVNENDMITNPQDTKFDYCYNLFFDGTWQKPERNMYWLHNDILLANGTSEDIKKCIDSATKGFATWSATPIDSRMCILSKLASILKCKGAPGLANIILKWLKLPYLYINSLTRHETEQFEITKIREPKGIILLREKDDATLFRELTQSLILGNSIIVICDPDLCTLAHYCDIFSTATIPPGVINLLSIKNATNFLCDNLATLNPEEIYMYLTIAKHIVVCLK